MSSTPLSLYDPLLRPTFERKYAMYIVIYSVKNSFKNFQCHVTARDEFEAKQKALALIVNGNNKFSRDEIQIITLGIAKG